MSRLLSGYLLWLVITASILSACSPSPARPTPQIPYQTSWSYADLRLLDPADAPEPAQDLLAVYINRPSGRNSPLIDIRLDFLDLSTHSQPDVYIALDYAYGGHSKLPLDSHTKLAWDVLLVLPAAGRILAVDKENRPLHDLQLRVIRDTGLDSLDIRLDASALFPSSDNLTLPEFKLQVFVTSAGLRRVSDASAVVRSFDPLPNRPTCCSPSGTLIRRTHLHRHCAVGMAPIPVRWVDVTVWPICCAPPTVLGCRSSCWI